jgi:hypothetical protein
MRTRLSTALSILIIFDGVSWALGALPALYYAFTRHDLPTVAGIKLLNGPFAKLGLEGFIVAGLMFVVVSGFKLLAAYWIWHSRKDGAVLQLILLGLSTIFWYGFALPLGPIEGIAEVVLLVMVWKGLS